MDNNKNNHYVDNKQFYLAIVERKKELREAKKKHRKVPPISNYLGECIFKIANHLINKRNHVGELMFFHYPMKEEMIGDAIENCIQYFDNYKIKYKNPFAYFTQICYWAFVRRIQKEKKTLYAKYKMHEQLSVLGELDGVNEKAVAGQFQVYDNIADFIDKYEVAQEKKNRAKKKAKKKSLSIKAKKRRIK